MAQVSAPCEIDFELSSHGTDVHASDWEVDCVKRSAGGNSGGVYFVQTKTNVVVVKPEFLVKLYRFLACR